MEERALTSIYRSLARLVVVATLGVLIPATAFAQLAPGTMVKWGEDFGGQFVIPADLTGVKAIAAGVLHAVVLKEDGTVAAFGPHGREGTNVPAGLSNVTAVAAGWAHTLALKADGTVVQWGNVSAGSPPAGLSGVVAVSTFGYANLALKSDGTVVAWGTTSFGQTAVPAGLSNVKAIGMGYTTAYAVRTDGTVVAWGCPSHHDFGGCTVPAGLTGVKAIAGGEHHAVALREDGTLVAWGCGSKPSQFPWEDDESNDNGQCDVPAGLSGVVAIASSRFWSLALKSDGTLVHWGNWFPSGAPSNPTGMTAIAAHGDFGLGANVVNEVVTANAGGEYSATGNSVGQAMVTLNGSGSSSTGSALTYAWTINGVPVGNAPSVTANLSIGTYTAQLKVTSSTGTVVTDTAAISVTIPTIGGIQGIQGEKGDTGDKGDKGDKGDTGSTGPQGEGLFSGSLVLLPVGVPAPAGYTLLGTYSLASEDAKKKGGLTVVVYRRN
jgi:alpha-tubulin suppressor-like RCC1 family protein